MKYYILIFLCVLCSFCAKPQIPEHLKTINFNKTGAYYLEIPTNEPKKGILYDMNIIDISSYVNALKINDSHNKVELIITDNKGFRKGTQKKTSPFLEYFGYTKIFKMDRIMIYELADEQDKSIKN